MNPCEKLKEPGKRDTYEPRRKYFLSTPRKNRLNQSPSNYLIVLPGQYTEEYRQLVARYAQSPRALTRTEWLKALEAFDLLHTGRIIQDATIRTFQQFYQNAIDAVYATLFLNELLATEDVELLGLSLVARYWQQITADLNAHGIVEGNVEANTLLIYCLYWWQSFGKGYIREVSVFQDLETSGVGFEAHNLSIPAQRRSLYDLTILGQRGDIKTSTYFLHMARFFPLRCDFYVVRLFDTVRNRWLDVVLLKRAAWDKLNGEPTICTWETVARVLPEAGQMEMRGETLVVVTYEIWKRLVLQVQKREGE